MASSDKHYHPIVANRLRALVEARDWEGLPLYLDTLSNSQFRTAGYMLGEMLTENLPDGDFWQLTQRLVSYNSKAFLVTLLKSAVGRGVNVEGDGFRSLCEQLKNNEIDVQKVLANIVPVLDTPDHIRLLFNLLGVNDPEKRLPYLLKATGNPASYVLFHTLKYLEHDRSLLIRAVYFLMKRGDDRSFNFASLLKSYFGLEEVKGSFSLRIEPYQLARLDGSYEAFSQALNS